MAIPTEFPCGAWVGDWNEVVACCPDAAAIIDPLTQAEILTQATEVAFQGSGRIFPGLCTASTRPCLACSGNCACCSWGYWGNYWGWGGGCCCEPRESLDLGTAWPVTNVLQVLVDGVVVLPAAYRLDDWRYLVRIDGGVWPRCQDLELDENTPGSSPTWRVDYEYGRPPPALGLRAVTAFACELAKACLDIPCQLPKRVTTLTREGVTMGLLDPFQFLAEGRTGIYEMDLFLTFYSRERMHPAHPGMMDPAHPRVYHRTGT